MTGRGLDCIDGCRQSLHGVCQFRDRFFQFPDFAVHSLTLPGMKTAFDAATFTTGQAFDPKGLAITKISMVTCPEFVGSLLKAFSWLMI